MKFTTPAVLTTIAFPILSLAQEPIFSNHFTSDATLEGHFIRESFTTLILPELNSPIGDSFLKIYPALYTNATASLSGTAQTIAEGSPCTPSLTEWCVGVRLVIHNTQNSRFGVLAAPGTHMTVHNKFDDAARRYDQEILIGGKVVASLPLDDELSIGENKDVGVATQWGTFIECQRAGCGTVPSHRYIDTKIVLDSPDPLFGNWTGKEGVSGGATSTSDGGLTWVFEDIVVDSFTWV